MIGVAVGNGMPETAQRDGERRLQGRESQERESTREYQGNRPEQRIRGSSDSPATAFIKRSSVKESLATVPDCLEQVRGLQVSYHQSQREQQQHLWKHDEDE